MPKLLKFKINIALLCTSDNMASSLFPSFFYLLAAHEILFNPTPLLLEFKLVILGSVNLKHTHIIPGCLAPKWHPRLLVCGSMFLRGMAFWAVLTYQNQALKSSCWRAKFNIRRSYFLAFSKLTVSNIRHFVALFWTGASLKSLLILCGCV